MRPTGGAMSADISVVLCTWNRAALLRDALAALTSQVLAPSHEIVVVDNGSTDDTEAVVRTYSSSNPYVHYVFESRQGLASARNAGVAASCAPVVAFTDDDVRVGGSWIRSVATAVERHPDAAYLGGPVVPRWPARVPPWLTERHWAPLGVQSYGCQVLRIDADRPLCLIGANLVVPRAVLEHVGGFEPSVQRVGDGAGSTEDQEWELRVWASGGHGVYDPTLEVEAVVTGDRVEKRHHRRWRFGHGRHIARMRLPEVEASRRRVFGVPGHILRDGAADAWGWCIDRLQGDERAVFDREARLCFAAGFALERWT
jgi:glucosyl-dolichyl phosphate glucuronosyltransferase